MSLKKARQIAKLQGIKLHREAPVLCPSCKNKCFILDLDKEQGRCINCGKKMSTDELLRLEQEQERDQHKEFENYMKNNKGVNGNY